MKKKAVGACRFGNETRKTFSGNTNPGPGNYEIPCKMVEGPQHRFTGESGHKNKKSGIPGPADYTPNFQVEQMATSAVSFTRSKRHDKQERVGVGPGQYNSSSLVFKDR